MTRSSAVLPCGTWLLVGLAGWLLAPGSAHARRFYRARFETEALDLQLPGQIELDSQTGAFYGDGPDRTRLVLPDVEIDVGVCSWLEIDLDAALAITQLDTSHKQLAGDPLWLSGRFGVVNWRDDDSDASFGIGVQLGPRLPSVNTPLGVGFAALAVFGGGVHGLQLDVNIGTLLDHGQSAAILYGLDASYDINETWSLLSNVAAAYYFGHNPAQLLLDVGFSYKVREQLSLSLLAIAGPLIHGDRGGGLLGVSYSFQAWGRARDSPRVQAPSPK